MAHEQGWQRTEGREGGEGIEGEERRRVYNSAVHYLCIEGGSWVKREGREKKLPNWMQTFSPAQTLK